MSSIGEKLSDPNTPTYGEVFKITMTDTVSIANLQEAQKAGISVTRSPHIGNPSPAQLICIDAGLPIILYDRNTGEKDPNYNPGGVVTQEKFHPITNHQTLISHALVETAPSIFPDVFQIGTRVAHNHIALIKRALPNANIRTYTEYLQSHSRLAHELSSIIATTHPQLWTRYVDEQGNITGLECHDRNQLEQRGIFGITNAQSGWLTPNVINVLFSGLFEALDTNSNEVIHVSGPAMATYVKTMQPQLDHFYELVKKGLRGSDIKIPDILKMHIIPMADVRFATSYSRRSNLDHLLLTWDDYKKLETDKDTALRTPGLLPEQKTEHIQKYRTQNPILRTAVADAFGQCLEITFDTSTQRYLSYADLVLEKERLYVPESIKQTPVGEVSRLYHDMRSLYNTINKPTKNK